MTNPTRMDDAERWNVRGWKSLLVVWPLFVAAVYAMAFAHIDLNYVWLFVPLWIAPLYCIIATEIAIRRS